MKKILVVNTVPMEMNGITNVIINLYENIDNDKYHMDFVAIDDCSKDIREKFAVRGSKLFIVKGRLRNPIIYVYKLAKIAKGYDIVHVHGNSATLLMEMVAAKCAGVTVRIAHSHNSTCKYVLVDKVCRPLFYKLCNGRLACGDQAGRWLFRKRKFTIIRNGINTEKYIFSEASRFNVRSKFGWDDDKIVLGHVGAFNEFKNQNFIIDIFAKLYKKDSRYRLLLVGEGPMLKEMKKKAALLEVETGIVFFGVSNYVDRLLNAVDLILMPSFNEGFPLTLVEEQANGLNCIVSDEIGQEVNLSGNVEFLPIRQGTELWINAILSYENFCGRKEKSEAAIKKIVIAGYDMKESVKTLENCYRRWMRNG